MKIMTKMILNDKEKIELNILDRKNIEIRSKYTKGIENYRSWLEKKNKCKVDVEKLENVTYIRSSSELWIISPGCN
jgi:hypothetical protein